MNLSSNNWSLLIDLNGGRIKELIHNGIKVFGTYHRLDGKTGNTHICAPSFDREGQEKYGLPFHGYARALPWNIKQQTTDTIQICTKTGVTDTYPAVLELSQEFQLDDPFTHSVSVRHVSGKEVPVNIAIHYYWDTPAGWNQIQIQNKNQRRAVETNGYINLEKTNTIVFPHASYEVRSNGFHTAMLWTSFKTDDIGNKVYNNDFCCIEPIIGWPGYFGSDTSILCPGETVSASIQIKKVV